MSDDKDISIENIIIKALYKDKKIREKIIPYLKYSLFDLVENIELMKFVKKFMEKYDKFPSVKETKLKIKNADIYEHLKRIISIDTSEYSKQFILSEIETHIREKTIMDICVDVVDKIQEGDVSKITMSPDALRTALGFSFDERVGLDVFNNDVEEEIYNFFHNSEYIVPTGLQSFDDIIEGGFHEKSLSLFLAETNLGKSLIMTALATNNILQNNNVLYISYEMSEYKITERILANIFDINIHDIKKMSKDSFSKAFQRIREKIKSKFIVKEYSPRGANVNHIRNLIKEIESKKKFKPDIIYVDYIGIMSSTENRKSDNTYTEIKRITEELRGLGVEFGIPIVSAVQSNRGGFGKDNIDLSNASDSVGTVFTGDVVVAVTQTEEMRAVNKYKWTTIKNRYGENKKTIPICVNYPKMRLSDDEEYIEKYGSKSSHKKSNKPVSNHNDSDDIDNESSKNDSIFIKRKPGIKKEKTKNKSTTIIFD